MNLHQILDRDLFPLVEKPSRYLGNEVNAVKKDPATVELRLALIFPDLYDLGLGNLGLHILYAQLNALPWAWCERAYAPALDMEALLRQRDLPLFALESKDPLGAFDALGVTLQSELTYTNILNILALAHIPLRAADRDDSHPLLFAGGPAVFNPEPLAPFFDFFVIGDGEDAMLEIANTLRDLRLAPKAQKIAALAALEGVYAPSLYPFITTPQGRVLPDPDAPKIRKRLTHNLNGATFPTNYIVPFTHQVHDRISLEVLRGCTQGCRFCQAGMTTRPVRERSIEKIDELMRRTLESTGYEEVSLVSLSTCDYSQVQRMVDSAVSTSREYRSAISLPSLRLDSFSVELADMVAETSRSGITFAPEAASPRLRALINKWIPDDDLLEMSSGAFQLGWEVIKLYFMIGLPTERDDDILAIADLATRTLARGRGIQRKARVRLGVSTFVPKPFTPFQWAPQITPEETERKQRLLSSQLYNQPGLKFGRHDPRETFVEGLISRSDRRAADLIEAAFRHGARFDAWGEHINLEAWQRAIEETGFDVQDAFRERDLDEPLPWDHLDILIDKEWFKEDWRRAMQLQWAQDCRHRKCLKCGVIDKERELCASMLRDNVKGRRAEQSFTRTPRQPHKEPPVAQRLWLRYGRTGSSRFLTHLEAMAAWLRALRRARAPMSWSQGFNPMPRLTFSAALPSGHETIGDYMDLRLQERLDPHELFARLRATLPDGFDLLSVSEVPTNAPGLMSLAQGFSYTLYFPEDTRNALARRLQALKQQEQLLIERKVKQQGQRVQATLDIKPSVRLLQLRPGDVPAADLVMIEHELRAGRPRDLLPLLTDLPDRARVLRRDTFWIDGDALRPLSEWTPSAAPAAEAPDVLPG